MGEVGCCCDEKRAQKSHLDFSSHCCCSGLLGIFNILGGSSCNYSTISFATTKWKCGQFDRAVCFLSEADVLEYNDQTVNSPSGSFYIPAVLRKLVRKYKEEEEVTQPCSIKADAVAKALGPDPRGRVRGLGFGALPSKVDGQTHVANKVTMLQNALAAQTQQVDRLTELVQGLVARLDKGENVNENTSVQHSANWIAQRKRKENLNCSSDIAQSKQKDASVISSNRERGSREQIKENTYGKEPHLGNGRPKKSQKIDAAEKV
ncbi:hypothetical protein ABKV19_000551 [Rosa sericea]